MPPPAVRVQAVLEAAQLLGRPRSSGATRQARSHARRPPLPLVLVLLSMMPAARTLALP